MSLISKYTKGEFSSNTATASNTAGTQGKAGGGVASDTGLGGRGNTIYKDSLDDLFQIPSIFKNYNVPDKIDSSFHAKVADDIYNYYLKGPTDYASGKSGNYMDREKMTEIVNLYELANENQGVLKQQGTQHIDKEISKDPNNTYYKYFLGGKPDYNEHMRYVYGWDSLTNRVKFNSFSVQDANKKWEEEVMPAYYEAREKYKQDDAKDMASYVVALLAKKNNMEETAKRTWGPDYQSNPEYQNWVGRNIDKWGGTDLENVVGSMTESGNVKDFKVSSDYWKPGVKNDTMVFGGGDFLEGIIDYTVDLATGIVEAPVTLVEAADDIIEGKNVGETLLDTTLKITGVQDLVDAVDNLAEGDFVGAVADTYEYGYGQQANIDEGTFITGATPPTASEIADTAIETIADVSDPSKDNLLANLREDINDVAMGEDIPVETAKEFTMPDIKKTTMNELKILLGLPDDAEDGAVIESLIGTEARKLAADPDIARMRQLQGQVSETGYDVGEREALSSRARRELAGMARKQGIAAGAAAGGLRGASVGAQARSLAETALQKQADVTTEMDKASIARKDAARQELAALAKDVTKFDIEKEQERKKRKGATTIGVQSLLQQEDIAKQQYDLALMDTTGQ